MRQLLFAALLVLVGAGIATAASGDQGRRLAGPFCVSAKTGVVRSVAATRKCKPGEVRKIGLALPTSKGLAGPVGPQGEQGVPGSTGPAGPAGPQGEKGEAGPAGSAGPTGEAGKTGAAGPTGKTGAAGPTGKTGAIGPTGDDGETGAAGPTGKTGATGPQGKSAYEVWLDAGHTGTVEDFFRFLRGADGKDGANGHDGENGHNGENGHDGAPGQNGHPGENGAPGLSAYQEWLAAGNSGTVGDFMKSLKGEKGDIGPPVSTTTDEICVNKQNHQISWGACDPGNGGTVTTLKVYVAP